MRSLLAAIVQPVIARLGCDRRGAAAVEFALVAPVLLLMLGGLVDGAQFIVQSMQVNAAAQAGADFALRNGWNAAGISGAVTGAAPIAVVALPAPTEVQRCVVNGVLAAPPGGACADGGPVGNFVVVGAQRQFTPLLPLPGLAQVKPINAQAMVRIP